MSGFHEMESCRKFGSTNLFSHVSSQSPRLVQANAGVISGVLPRSTHVLDLAQPAGGYELFPVLQIC